MSAGYSTLGTIAVGRGIGSPAGHAAIDPPPDEEPSSSPSLVPSSSAPLVDAGGGGAVVAFVGSTGADVLPLVASDARGSDPHATASTAPQIPLVCLPPRAIARAYRMDRVPRIATAMSWPWRRRRTWASGCARPQRLESAKRPRHTRCTTGGHDLIERASLRDPGCVARARLRRRP